MIEFFIEFLICFTKPKPYEKKETKKKKGAMEASKKGTGNEKSKPSTESEEIKQDSFIKTADESVVECKEQAREWCHIEYCLLESVFPNVEINVVTWGAAAKIFTQDDCRAIKTVVIDDFVWVYFIMAHKIRKLVNSEVEQLKASEVLFTFSQNPTKMMTRAINDWPKKFTICKTPSEVCIPKDKWFLELHETDPPDDIYKEILTERVNNYKVTRPDRNSVVSMLQVSPCLAKIKEKILAITRSLPPVRESLKETIQIKSDKNVKKGKKDNKKKGKDAKKSIDEFAVLSLKAELLVAGKFKACTEQKEVSSSLRYVEVLANASKILTDEQDSIFVPLTVTIKSVHSLPTAFIKKFNLKNIFARYEFGSVLNDIQTGAMPVTGEDVFLNDTRVFFISSPSEQDLFPEPVQRPSVFRLIEALMTRRLVVKLYGEKEFVAERTSEPCLFGQRSTDEFISTPGHEMFLKYRPSSPDSGEVFLGSATFTLIELVKGFQRIEASSILTSAPVSTWDPACDLNDLLDDAETKEARKAVMGRFSTRGCIPETILLEYSTSVEVEVTIGYLLTSPSERQLLILPNIYQRLIVIFKDRCFVNSLLERVTTMNFMMGVSSMESVNSFYPQSTSDILEPTPSLAVSIQSVSSLVNHYRQLRKIVNESQKTITGFQIESDEECIVVLETIPNIISYLTDPLQVFLPEHGQFTYDSNIFFTKRLYENFTPHSLSLYKIKLATTLSELLKNSSYFLTKSTPKLAVQALLLLDLLRRSRTISGAAANQLFPSTKQLISFNKTFGAAEHRETP